MALSEGVGADGHSPLMKYLNMEAKKLAGSNGKLIQNSSFSCKCEFKL